MPLGSVGLVTSSRGLKNVILSAGDPVSLPARLRRLYPDGHHDPDMLPRLRKQFERYFAGERVHFDVPVDLTALTPFQREVLDACRTVAYGDTITYGQLARLIGRPDASRAVGGAMARNPIPLVLPCHRIVASSGRLGGFSAEQGVRLKQWLLDLEASGAGRPRAARGKRRPHVPAYQEVA